ncbi:MAG: site-specific DNA-methyltransferase [Pseudomonadales bacterium]|nr:site-specific DNA-methyltransferase [Pseudomonadales bacterium]
MDHIWVLGDLPLNQVLDANVSSHYPDSDRKSWKLPDEFSDDIRLSEEVIERYIDRFSNPGDLIFDPFGGYGTVLVVAERMGREAIGFEIDETRAKYANSLLSESTITICDVRDQSISFPSSKLCISSPPYMNKSDPENPLDNYRSPVSGYHDYVRELADIYIRVTKSLIEGGHLVVQLQNLKNETVHTPLAFDLYCAIGENARFLGEEVTTWNDESYGYSHGYCLIYAGV